MDPIALRSIERIVAVIIGGASIYLGYRLFLAIPDRAESEARFLLPGGISIYMTRIGPGGFLALFGAVVVAISFYQSIKYSESFPIETIRGQSAGPASQTEQPASGEQGVAARSYAGFGGTPDRSDIGLARLQAASDIKFLNDTLPELLRGDMRPQSRTDVAVLVPRLKLAILKTVWNSDWGDFAKFKEWVESGAAEPAPKDLVGPARLYLRGGV